LGMKVFGFCQPSLLAPNRCFAFTTTFKLAHSSTLGVCVCCLQGFLRGSATDEQAAEVVVHALGTPVPGWLWDERKALAALAATGRRPASAKRPGSARRVGLHAPDTAVPITDGYRVEARACTLGGVVPPVDIMVWVTAAAGDGGVEWSACRSEHWPHPTPSQLLARTEGGGGGGGVGAGDLGPQALWTDVGLALSPAKRPVVPAGLLCGLREEHNVRELLRLYAAQCEGGPPGSAATSAFEVPVPTAAELRLASGRKPYTRPKPNAAEDAAPMEHKDKRRSGELPRRPPKLGKERSAESLSRT